MSQFPKFTTQNRRKSFPIPRILIIDGIIVERIEISDLGNIPNDVVEEGNTGMVVAIEDDNGRGYEEGLLRRRRACPIGLLPTFLALGFQIGEQRGQIDFAMFLLLFFVLFFCLLVFSTG